MITRKIIINQLPQVILEEIPLLYSDLVGLIVSRTKGLIRITIRDRDQKNNLRTKE